MNRTAAEEKAVTLLGRGFLPDQVSSATGLTVGRISQIASDKELSKEISDLRFQELAKHTERDSKADDLEDLLLDKLKETSQYLMRPLEIAKVYATVNGAKRRGASAPESTTNQNPVVPIVMPTLIVNHFTKNINNQVVEVGAQALTTIQPHALSKLHGLRLKGPEGDPGSGKVTAPAVAEAEVVGGK